VQSHWQDSAGRHGLPVQVGGFPCFANFRFEHPHADELRTLYTQMMLARGFLGAAGLYPTLAHTDAIVDLYGEAIDSVFKEIADVLASGDELSVHLRGPVAHSGFRRLAG
jgi:glutamate-1-semialdehyde 2,1-aminomutase